MRETKQKKTSCVFEMCIAHRVTKKQMELTKGVECYCTTKVIWATEKSTHRKLYRKESDYLNQCKQSVSNSPQKTNSILTNSFGCSFLIELLSEAHKPDLLKLIRRFTVFH